MSTVLAASPSWEATLGLVGVFFILFPLLAHGLIAFAVAQVFGERRENQEYEHGDAGTSRG